MANEIVSVFYTSASGAQLRTGINKEVFAQVDGSSNPLVGGTAAPYNSTAPQLSRSMKPRRAVVMSATGLRREVILLTADAPLATLGTTIALEDSDGASTNYTSVEVRPEQFRRRKKQP